ncbi:MAG: hypothetical protein ACRBF0_13425 [Calditrichia bacterium]
MKIVDSNSMFTLISVDGESTKDGVKLKLEGNPQKQFKYQLLIYGLKKKSEFVKEISEFVGAFIDVDELKDSKLDFWSDAYQIGEFEFERYEEIVKPFEMEDWISKYNSLSKHYAKCSENYSTRNLRWRKFIDNLEFFLKKEIGNYEAKIEFLAEDQKATNSAVKAFELARGIQNLLEQYRIEEQKDGF